MGFSVVLVLPQRGHYVVRTTGFILYIEKLPNDTQLPPANGSQITPKRHRQSPKVFLPSLAHYRTVRGNPLKIGRLGLIDKKTGERKYPSDFGHMYSPPKDSRCFELHPF